MNSIVVTGATSGIGLETVRLLAGEGYHVLAVGHIQTHCEKADRDIRAGIHDAKIEWYAADLMKQREVIRVAGEIKSLLDERGDGKLYALINNAGCARSWYMTTEDGYEQQFALNCLAGFLLTHELLPYLLKAKGRVIMTSSRSHKGIKVHWDDVMLSKRYNPLTAYKQSKLCNILFAQGLNDLYASEGLRAYAVDPGLVNTDIGNKTAGIVDFVWRLRKRHGVSPTVPAKTYSYLCEHTKAPTGLYYYLCKERSYSKQVTSESAKRLFALSGQLCGVHYGKDAKR